MDLRRNSGNESGQSIASALVSAVLEWMLMFMIFVDASFAYLVTRFARHCRLRAPCLLCSRLDHVLGNEGGGFYWDLICDEHKSKITSFVVTQLQNDRVDGDVAREINERSSRLDQIRGREADPLPHVEYSQIKDCSDTESEGPFSDTESARVLVHETDLVSAEVARSPAPEKLIHPDGKDFVEPSDLIDFSYVHPSPDPAGIHADDSRETNDARSAVELEKDVHVECGETSNLEIDPTGGDELWKEVKTDDQENSRAVSTSTPPNEIQMDVKSCKIETSSQATGPVDLGDAYRLALGARGRQLSGRLEQQRSITDRVSEDLRLLLSQISAARGLDLPSNDISPKVSANGEDFKPVDGIGAQIFQRRISLERNESNLSLDGSSVGEVEGESDVDRLRRQVEQDKKILAALYRELEEERSASSIAANQAMAMITRLQEEKAAFHMEALQCVRMLEEQAEYDNEALQNANMLVAENEKRIQHLQVELESYRNRFGDVPEYEDNRWYNSDIKTVDGTLKMSDRENETLQSSFQRFEDEKRHILECLKTVEEKLFTFTKHEVYSPTEESLEVSASDQPEFVGSEKNHPKRDTEKSQHENEGYGKSRPGQYGSEDVELAAVRNELCVISNRLRAIEAEQSVIESSINALEKGSEGYEFVREIAARLHELHSARVMKERKEDST